VGPPTSSPCITKEKTNDLQIVGTVVVGFPVYQGWHLLETRRYRLPKIEASKQQFPEYFVDYKGSH
jgi:hypothetical protein